MKRVELHIDRLVLHGVPAEQREAVVARFRQALLAGLQQPGAVEAWAQQGHPARIRLEVPASPAGNAAGWSAAAALALAHGVRR